MSYARAGIAVVCMLCANAASAAALGAVKSEPAEPPAPPPPPVTAPVAPAAPPAAPIVTPAPVAPPKVTPPGLRDAGKYALAFGIDNDVSLTGVVRLSERTAWLWSASGDLNRESDRVAGQTTYERTKSTDWGGTLAAGYRQYLRPGTTNPFVEGMLGLSYRRLFQQNVPVDGSTAPSVETTQDEVAVSGSLNLGLEYFVARNFSLEGSVGVTLEYFTREGDAKRSDVDETLDTSGHGTRVQALNTAVRAKFYW